MLTRKPPHRDRAQAARRFAGSANNPGAARPCRWQWCCDADDEEEKFHDDGHCAGYD